MFPRVIFSHSSCTRRVQPSQWCCFWCSVIVLCCCSVYCVVNPAWFQSEMVVLSLQFHYYFRRKLKSYWRRLRSELALFSQQTPPMRSSRESNPSRRICNLRVLPLGQIANPNLSLRKLRRFVFNPLHPRLWRKLERYENVLLFLQ